MELLDCRCTDREADASKDTSEDSIPRRCATAEEADNCDPASAADSFEARPAGHGHKGCLGWSSFVLYRVVSR